MFNYKKVAYVGLAVATVGSSAILLTSSVGAMANPSKLSLAADLAQTFHLNQATVQTTIAQYHSTHPHHKKIDYSQRLAAEVKKGKITSAQEQAIMTEHTQIMNSLSGLKNETPAQKQATIKSTHAIAKAWAKTNNVPVGLLFAHHPRKSHR